MSKLPILLILSAALCGTGAIAADQATKDAKASTAAPATSYSLDDAQLRQQSAGASAGKAVGDPNKGQRTSTPRPYRPVCNKAERCRGG